MLRALAAACVGLLGSGMLASGQDTRILQGPAITIVQPDWLAVRADAARLTADIPVANSSGDPLATLTGALSAVFPAISESSVPVLLPFDVPAFVRAAHAGTAPPALAHLSGFRESGFFLAGPAGYDAAFSVRAADVPSLSDVGFSHPVIVEISASALHYDLPPASGAVELPAGDMARDFPNLRRFILESYLRYSFERYGVTYVVAISCFDGRPRPRWISCKSADRIARHFLGALNLAGGTPADLPSRIERKTVERPQESSADFIYHSPGQLLPGTGFRKNGGVADATVYADIRYPFAAAPSFVNSQSFMNWGDCAQTGRSPHPRGRKGAAYRCRINSKQLVFDESAPENYSYPWRDNFCEYRHFYVGQCPGGQGHQGQDIRPASCKLANEGADRCEPYRDDLVAVRAGMILRAQGQEAVFLTSNTSHEHVRFRYMHMHPDYLDADHVVSGRLVREGEVLGTAGNFNKRENLTTYHLHFEMMVPTRDGWVRVNPYMTLVASYERLIGARGREIDDPGPAVAIPETSGPSSVGLGSSEIENGASAGKPVKYRTRKAKKLRRR